MVKAPIKPSLQYKPNALLQYPENISGNKDLMLAFCLDMKEMWTIEAERMMLWENTDSFVVEKPLISSDEHHASINNNRKTLDMAAKLRIELKKEYLTTEKIEAIKDKIGILRPSLTTQKFSVTHTVATSLFGSNFFIKPTLFLSLIFISIYGASALISFLAVWGFIPSIFSYASLGVWPQLIYKYIVLFNIDVAKQVLMQHQTIIFNAWAIIFFISMVIEYRGKENYEGIVLFWTGALFSFISVPLVDSISDFDSKIIITKLLFPSCLCLMIIHQIAMLNNWSELPVENNIFLFGHISLTMTALGFTSLNNMIILVGLNIIAGFRFPQSLIMVKSRVEAVVMTEDEAVALRAMDQIGRETTERNKLQRDIVQIMMSKIIKLCAK